LELKENKTVLKLRPFCGVEGSLYTTHTKVKMIGCGFLHDESCRIVQESCRIVQESCRIVQESCRIVLPLNKLFLLGDIYEIVLAHSFSKVPLWHLYCCKGLVSDTKKSELLVH